MAFTFTVEDGTIVAGANSYVTVQEADDYLSQNIHVGPIWAALDTTSKQYLLAWATRYLDQRASWRGITSTAYLANPDSVNVIASFIVIPSNVTIPQQPLRWPRANVYDWDENPIAYNVIPQQLKEATIEMARYLIASDRSLERPQDGLKELKIDVLTLIFKDQYSLPIVPSEISFIIRGLGTISSGTTNFAKITRA